jgi:hypothetical protein
MRATKPAREKVSIIYRTLDNQRSLETETIGRLETTGDDVPVQALLQLQQRTEACGQPGGLDISQEEVRTAVTRVYTATIAALKDSHGRHNPARTFMLSRIRTHRTAPKLLGLQQQQHR